MMPILPRREFLASVPAVLSLPAFLREGATLAPNTAASVVHKSRLSHAAPRIAIIGCGGRGADNLGDLLGAGANVVALCDVFAPARDAALAGQLLLNHRLRRNAGVIRPCGGKQ